MRDVPVNAAHVVAGHVFAQLLEVHAAPLEAAQKMCIRDRKDDVDAVFSPDGRFLFCLPSLVKVSEDKAQNIETFARHSRLLSVVDVETGKIVKEFSLATPVEKH